MKRLFLLGLLCVSANLQASILTFDDLGYDEAYIADGYGGFNWTNGDVAPVLSMNAHLQDQDEPQNGFKNSVISGSNIVFNGWGESHSVIEWAGSGTFNFTGAYWTSGWENQSLYFEGLSGGAVKYISGLFDINTESPIWIQLDWQGVDQLRINNSGSHWAMDDFTYSVPEGNSLILLVIGLFLVILRRSFRNTL